MQIKHIKVPFPKRDDFPENNLMIASSKKMIFTKRNGFH